MEPNIKQSSRWVIGILNIISLIVSIPVTFFVLLAAGLGNTGPGPYWPSQLVALSAVASTILVIIFIALSQMRRDKGLAVLAICMPFMPIGFITLLAAIF